MPNTLCQLGAKLIEFTFVCLGHTLIGKHNCATTSFQLNRFGCNGIAQKLPGYLIKCLWNIFAKLCLPWPTYTYVYSYIVRIQSVGCECGKVFGFALRWLLPFWQAPKIWRETHWKWSGRKVWHLFNWNFWGFRGVFTFCAGCSRAISKINFEQVASNQEPAAQI